MKNDLPSTLHIHTSQRQMSESFWTLTFLTLSGAFQDAYSYFARGQVFSNALTGNLVLMAAYIAQGDMNGIVRYLVPVCFFAVGIYCAQMIRMHFHHTRFHWRQLILIVEILLLMSLPFIRSDLIANSISGFACAMQVQSFRKIHGYPFATTMCLGNTRSAMDALAMWTHTRKREYLVKFADYVRVILTFIIGGGFGFMMVKTVGNYAIWGCCVMLLVSLCIMFIHEPFDHLPRKNNKKAESVH